MASRATQTRRVDLIHDNGQRIPLGGGRGGAVVAGSNSSTPVCESKLIGTTAALLPIIPPSPDLLKFILTGDLSEYEKRRALRKARDARRAAEPLKRNRSGT